MPRRRNLLTLQGAPRRSAANATAVIYCRVSTQDQAEKGVSLDVQQAECERFARERGFTVPPDGLFIERGESAKTIENRAVLRRLLAYCERHRPAAVVIYNTDRISRNVEHHGVIRYNLRAWGVQLLSVREQHDDTAAGRLTTNMFAVMSQFDNDLRSEKTTTAMQHLEAQGYWLHKNPNGYAFADEPGTGRRILVPIPETARLLRSAFTQMATGQFTQREVCEAATVRGLRKQNGTPYNVQAFSELLRNCLYAGLIETSWTAAPLKGRHAPIVPYATFLRVQEVLRNRSPITQRRVVARPEFPLRRFVRCGRTGRTFTGGFSRGKGGKRYGYYFPYRYPPGSQNVRAEQLEAAFLSFLEGFTISSEHRPLIEATLRALWAERHKAGEEERKDVEARLRKLRDERMQLTRKLAQGTLSDDAYRAAVTSVDDEIRTTEQGLVKQPVEGQDVERMIASCLSWIEHLGDAWKRGGYAEKQRLQALLFPAGVVYDEGVVRTPETSHLLAVIGAIRDGVSGWAAPGRRRLNAKRRRHAEERRRSLRLLARVRRRRRRSFVRRSEIFRISASLSRRGGISAGPDDHEQTPEGHLRGSRTRTMRYAA